MRIAVLTSTENFVWSSMQEIIPHIEETWQDYEKTVDQDIPIINVDALKLNQLLPQIINVNQLVVTCFNHRISQILKFVRFDLKLNISFIIYVHNMATISFWPFRHWINENPFIESDVFVTTCENDNRTILQVLPLAKTFVLPFFKKSYVLNDDLVPDAIDSIVYIGRVSPQKNLHNLIFGYALSKKNNPDLPDLIIYGNEDHLGSPNCGIKCIDYLNNLKNLTSKLNIEKNVKFSGFVSREEIQKKLSSHKNLVISASLHSDENFGMAILQGLCTQNYCLISDWGGHSDFKKYYSDYVTYMPVTMSLIGPALTGAQISMSINNFLKEFKQPKKISNDHSDFNTSRAVFKKILKVPYANFQLKFSNLGEQIYAQKNSLFLDSPSQIFTSFADPLFCEISSHYIGSTKSITTPDMHTPPWVNKNLDGYAIEDDHKGFQQINTESVEKLHEYGYS